jgi:deoxyadenosine/deoxycytidine kinase
MQFNAVALGGLIGAGKTTAITAAVQALRGAEMQAVAVLEPVDEWARSGRLAEFYSDPGSHALEFQKYVLQTRVDAITDAVSRLDPSRPAVLLLDRGLDDDRSFAQANHAMGNMTAAELEAYEAALAAAKTDLPGWARPPLRLWLEVPVDTCAARCAGRARNAETAVSTEYLRCLDQFRPTVDDHIDGAAAPAAVAAELAVTVTRWLNAAE